MHDPNNHPEYLGFIRIRVVGEWWQFSARALFCLYARVGSNQLQSPQKGRSGPPHHFAAGVFAVIDLPVSSVLLVNKSRVALSVSIFERPMSGRVRIKKIGRNRIEPFQRDLVGLGLIAVVFECSHRQKLHRSPYSSISPLVENGLIRRLAHHQTTRRVEELQTLYNSGRLFGCSEVPIERHQGHYRGNGAMTLVHKIVVQEKAALLVPQVFADQLGPSNSPFSQRLPLEMPS